VSLADRTGAFQLLVIIYRGLRQFRDTEDILHILYNNHCFETVLGQKTSELDPSSIEMKLVRHHHRESLSCVLRICLRFFSSSF
jgi:hypothetical protein